jgi:formylglycine-generating enzyme required for sulfatase activity
VVWCNAYSEAAGKTPVYYLEGTTNFGDTTRVLRESENSSVSSGNGKAEKAVINTNASGFRLPTEAEWEYAARGGDPTDATNWGYTYAGTSDQNSLGNYAWYDSNAGIATHPVGEKDANTAGLHDMSGNVREWCWDWHSSNVGTGTVSNPTGAASGTFRVSRGGSWLSFASDCTVAYRGSNFPLSGSHDLGLRVVCP